MWNLVLLVVSSLLSSALAPRPPQPRAAAPSDVQVPSAEEGRPIPVVFGMVLLRAPNVVWYGDLLAEPIMGGGGGKK